MDGVLGSLFFYQLSAFGLALGGTDSPYIYLGNAKNIG